MVCLVEVSTVGWTNMRYLNVWQSSVKKCDLETVSHCHHAGFFFLLLHRHTETWHTLNSRRGEPVTPRRRPQRQRNAFWKISASSWRTETRPSRESQIWASNRVITDYGFSYFLFADFNSVDLHQTGGFRFSLLLRQNIQFDFWFYFSYFLSIGW